MNTQFPAMRRLTALAGTGALVIGTLAGTAALVVAPTTSASAVAVAGAPTSATDATKVPHYFGPWPNWANSPFTSSTGPGRHHRQRHRGRGRGEGRPGHRGIKSIDVTAPGHGYADGATTVTVTGGTTDATATATVLAGGSVVGFTVDTPGGGYSGFTVDVTGGGGAARPRCASGGVDAVQVSDGGSGYTMPTVDFDLPDDPAGHQARGHVDPADLDANGTVTKVIVDDPGSGYSTAPHVVIHNGTVMDPISGATPATTTARCSWSGSRSATTARATPPPRRRDRLRHRGRLRDGRHRERDDRRRRDRRHRRRHPGCRLPHAGDEEVPGRAPAALRPDALPGAGCPTDPTAKFLPLAVPEEVTVNGVKADQYEIGLVQYKTKFSSDLPGTLVRGYVQLSHGNVQGQAVPLENQLMDGTSAPVTGGYSGVTSPQWLGPIIAATKDKPVRIVFRNLLPNNGNGDLFLPVDSTGMGSGMGPMTMAAPPTPGPSWTAYATRVHGQQPQGQHVLQGRPRHPAPARRHHAVDQRRYAAPVDHPGGGEHPWPQGVSVSNVPDMLTNQADPTTEVCKAKDDGCSTFFYTNQQCARLMFYHDHSYGITRLNVYAGEAAGYAITDDTEKKLVNDGTIPGAGDTMPLIVQDRTFVPGTRPAASCRTPRGTPPGGGPRAASGTTTSTCRRRTRATPRA